MDCAVSVAVVVVCRGDKVGSSAGEQTAYNSLIDLFNAATLFCCMYKFASFNDVSNHNFYKWTKSMKKQQKYMKNESACMLQERTRHMIHELTNPHNFTTH